MILDWFTRFLHTKQTSNNHGFDGGCGLKTIPFDDDFMYFYLKSYKRQFMKTYQNIMIIHLFHISVPMEDPTLREMAEYVEANRDEIWEKIPGNRQVTLLVFREGDQLNFFRVVDRGDGTLTPLSESLR